MAIDLSKKSPKKIDSPPCILVYGAPGIGKTRFGIGASKESEYKIGKPNHILMNIDFRGADRIECTRMFDEPIDSINPIKEGFAALAEQDHKFEWLAIDDTSTLEEIFVKETCKEYNVDNLKSIEYGRGYELARANWYLLFNMIEELQRMKNIGVVIISHTKVENQKDPMAESYSKHDLQLDKRSREIVKDKVELIGFAHKKVMTVTKDEGFGKKSHVAVGEAQRVLTLSPDLEGFNSKDRFGLPEEIEFDWNIFEEELKKTYQNKKSQNQKGEK